MGTGKVGEKKVSVMRDSGSTVCTLRRSLARRHEFTGRHLELSMLNSAVVSAPEVSVLVEAPYYSGWITAAALENPL